MNPFFLSVALATLVATGATADAKSELSKPIVAFTPVIVKNADALELTADQRADLKAWLDAMPAQRKALEAEALAARAALREAIIAAAPQEERAALAAQVGDMETRLVLMRSACTDHWRGVLSEAQFARMLEFAAAQ